MNTWLTPYAKTWVRVYPDSIPPFKQLARYLKPLTAAHSPERIVSELTAFLRATEPRYLNLAKFAATFGSWSPRTKSRQYPSVDECDRKAGIPVNERPV